MGPHRSPRAASVPVVLVVAAALLAVALAGCSRSSDDATTGPAISTPGSASRPSGTVVSTTPGGLPTLQEPPVGFALNDYLDLRVAMGPGWYLMGVTGSACAVPNGVEVPATDQGGGAGTVPVVANYEGPPITCKKLRQFRVHNADDAPWPDAHAGAFGIDHALQAEVRGEECDGCAVQIRFVDLHMQVDVDRLDADSRGMLDLLSASPWHQALSDGPMADTTGWQRVDDGAGLTALVPPAWLPAHDLRTDPAATPACDQYPFAAGSTVYLGVPGMPVAGTVATPEFACRPRTPEDAARQTWGPPIHPAADGLWLQPLGTFQAATVKRTVAGQTYGLRYPFVFDGGLAAYGTPAAPRGDPVRSIYTTVVGELDGRWFQVGLGPDPTIARTILANLRAT